MEKRYLPFSRLFLQAISLSVCFSRKSMVSLWEAQSVLKYSAFGISSFLTILYVISLLLDTNFAILLSLMILSQIVSVGCFVCFSAYFGLILYVFLCLSLDAFLIWLRRRKNVLIYIDNSEKCVYMKRNIVQNRTVVLHMGEFVQLVTGNEEESDTVKVRKFNGEEFMVNQTDIVDNVEDVLGDNHLR